MTVYDWVLLGLCVFGFPTFMVLGAKENERLYTLNDQQIYKNRIEALEKELETYVHCTIGETWKWEDNLSKSTRSKGVLTD